MAELLLQDERVLLSRVMRANPKHTAAPTLPFFREPGSKSPLDSTHLRRIMAEAMGDIFGGSGWTFHHFRHSAFNNLLLALESEEALALELAGWSASQQERIRLAVIGDAWSRQKRYYALAAFAGHATPKETFSSYIHLAREVIAQRVGRMEIDGEVALYAEAVRMGPDRLASCQTDNDVRRLIEQKLKWPAEEGAAAGQGPKAKPRAARSRDDEVWVAFQALTLIEQGASVDEAAFAQGLTADQVKVWLQRAQCLAGLVSRQGASRLVTRKRAARMARNPHKFEILLPAPLKTDAERRDTKSVIATLREAIKHDSASVDWAIAYGLDHSVQSKSGIRFREIEDLTRFLAFFEKSAFAGERWHLSVYLADPHDVPSWALRLPKGATYDVTPQASAATKRKGWRRGHCVLHLRGGETGPKAVKRSSPALRFALHMMAIVAVGRVDIP